MQDQRLWLRIRQPAHGRGLERQGGLDQDSIREYGGSFREETAACQLAQGHAMPRLTLRIDFDEDRAIGPGKIRLLELIDKHGSISEAGRQMGMSYRRAWLLVDNLNHCFRTPVVASQTGGLHGGGASLTDFGRAVVQHYREVEAAAHTAGAAHIEALAAALAERANPPSQTPQRKTRRMSLSVT
jgi:molybdate transport system regulatory protein